MKTATLGRRLPRSGRAWAYLTMTRPANVVTALADVLAGAAAAGALVGLPGLLLATAALYAGGVVLNDVFDAALDAVERPERPIPDGRASRAGAAALGGGLLVLGVAAAGSVSLASMAVAAAVAGMVLLYDAWAKHHALAGPLAMGACRGLNLMLGVSVAPALVGPMWPLALLPIAYIAAITAISRGEVHGGGRRVGWLAVGLVTGVLAALLAITWIGTRPAWAVLPFMALLAARVLPPFVAAARRPRPELIGAAVRAGVLSLILLDAALAAAFAGPLYAAAVLALWPVSLGLARLFAVT